MNNKTAYQLLIYIAENLNISSGFLSPQPMKETDLKI